MRLTRLCFLVLVLLLGSALLGCTHAPPAKTQATSTPRETVTAGMPVRGSPEAVAETLPAPATATLSPTHTPSPVPAAPPSTVSTECPGLISELTKSSVRMRVMAGLNVGVVVGAVAPCGTEFYAEGSMSLAGDQPVDEDSLFEIGSVGKVFTALILADMVERGEVSFDDPVEAYLPLTVTVPVWGQRSMTLADLATHTSGLASIPDNMSPLDWRNPYADYTVAQMYEYLSSTSLHSEPGVQYEYSNLGMGLLGHVLALRAGTTYESLVVERVALELGMPDTRTSLSPDQRSRLAQGHRDGEAFPNWDNPTLAGAGALYSSARDLLTFVQANLGLTEGRLLPAMLATHEPRHPLESSMQVGFGWHIRTRGDTTIIEHHGATGGYWSYVGFVKRAQVGVVILTNTYEDIDEVGLSLLDALLARSIHSAVSP